MIIIKKRNFACVATEISIQAIYKPKTTLHWNEERSLEMENDKINEQRQSLLKPTSHSVSSSFTTDTDDIPPIDGVRDFYREFSKEFKKLGYLAGPAILTYVFQYSLCAVSQVFAGNVSTLALAAFSVENSVIAGFSYGIMHGNKKHNNKRNFNRQIFVLMKFVLILEARHGKRAGHSLRASVWGGSSKYAGDLHAEVVGDS